ncbi:MAG: hypothetical protein K2L34_14545 [Muribaculaceae bacterium]|nr:hypothetical protein [Muribaculaceae bacterium]
MKLRAYHLIWRSAMLIVILMLSSCMHRRMTHLNDEDLKWMDNFNKYPTCTFTSNRGSHSTLVVKEYNVWNSRNPFFISSNQSWDYEAAAEVVFEVLQSNRLLKGCFQIRKVLPQKKLAIFAILGNRTTNDLPLQDVKEFKYKGTMFKECVIVDSLNSHISPTKSYPFESDVKEMVVSKEYGLIYYSFSDGEEFFRDFE